MKNRAIFLGLDISTTGAKALLIDAQGNVIDSCTHPLELSTPKPLWSEQNPLDWWDGMVKSIHNVIKQAEITGNDIKAIGLTGQMHGLVMLDGEGNVLRPAILWNDQRTAKQCDDIRNLVGRQELINTTGNDALTGFTAPKILWVQQNEPEVFNSTRHILLPKDYIRYRLTHEFATDKAGASGTILFDLRNRDWSNEILGKLSIPVEWLPKTFEGPEITGVVQAEAASVTGLRTGIPVIGGGGDQAAQAVGVGAVEPGIIGLTLGTSGVVFAPTPGALIEPQGKLHAFCHAVPGQWHLMGVMLSAAGSFQWYRNNLAPDCTYDDLTLEAGEVSAGSEGLLFMPYLTGERTPYPDPYARAGWIGITIRHNRKHMSRALLEGVAFGLKDSFELVKSAGLGSIEQVRVSGGGARSPVWRQILASVFNTELVTVNTTEGAAFGAALLAGVGSGNWDSVQEACASAIKITGSDQPKQSDLSIYEQQYGNYKMLYPALSPLFNNLA